MQVVLFQVSIQEIRELLHLLQREPPIPLLVHEEQGAQMGKIEVRGSSLSVDMHDFLHIPEDQVVCPFPPVSLV